MARKPFPSLNPLRPFVQDELYRRRTTIPTPAVTPFVRMVSELQHPTQKWRFLTLGLHGQFQEGQDVFELSYGSRDVIGYAWKNGSKVLIDTSEVGTEAGGRHPVPGILSARANHKGVNDVIEVTITWKCYNRSQLEFLRTYFLTAGVYVFLEYGHISSDILPPQTFDWGAADAPVKLAQLEDGGREAIINSLSKGRADRPNRGNYNLLISKIIDSQIQFNEDGSYTCTTMATSVGDALFGVSNRNLIADILREATQRRGEEGEDKFGGTIEEYFDEGNAFDRLMSLYLNGIRENIDVTGQPAVVRPPLTRWSAAVEVGERATQRIIPGGIPFIDTQEERDAKGEYGEHSDVWFISWPFFLNTVIRDMLGVIQADDVSSDILLFFNINRPFYHELGPPAPGSDLEPSVGYSPELKSILPEAMIIVTEEGKAKDIEENDEPPLFTGPHFGKATAEDGVGYLSRGVYLNVGMIKQAFRSNNLFYDAFLDILASMNKGSADLWRLDMAFDEERKRIKIFDRALVYTTPREPISSYVFNQGTYGETLSLDFSAQYSKEVKSAIILGGGATAGGGLLSVSNALSTDYHGQTLNKTTVYRVDGTKVEFGDKDHLVSDSLRILRAAEIESILEEKIPEVSGEQNAEVDAAEARDERISQLAKDISKDREILKDRLKDLNFNVDVIWPYAGLQTIIKSKVLLDGAENLHRPNSLIAPVPTEISLNLTVQGISGISFMDTFLVDKLPVVYAKYGTFYVSALEDTISKEGWTTTIGGMYYFLHTDEIGDSELQQIRNKQLEISAAEQKSYDIPKLQRQAKRERTAGITAPSTLP